MGQKIDTRAIGLDTGLAFIRWLTGAENLHYGLWDGLDVTAGNLRRAQDAYTDRLFAQLPPGRLRILDIGGGAGETARKLLALGHAVDIVVPSAYLAGRCRENAPGAIVHQCTLQEFGGKGPYDLCLFSESFQYIPLPEGLPRCVSLLAPGGTVLIADVFRTEAYIDRQTSGPQPGGGHRVPMFREFLASLPLSLVHEEDITDSVAASVDIEQGLFNVLGVGLLSLQKEAIAKTPGRWRVLTGAVRLFVSARRRANLMQRLTERSRTSDAFRRYSRYFILKLQRP